LIFGNFGIFCSFGASGAFTSGSERGSRALGEESIAGRGVCIPNRIAQSASLNLSLQKMEDRSIFPVKIG
jgi:hypothetical protein